MAIFQLNGNAFYFLGFVTYNVIIRISSRWLCHFSSCLDYNLVWQIYLGRKSKLPFRKEMEFECCFFILYKMWFFFSLLWSSKLEVILVTCWWILVPCALKCRNLLDILYHRSHYGLILKIETIEICGILLSHVPFCSKVFLKLDDNLLT